MVDKAKAVYWFEAPYIPMMKFLAVSPYITPWDGRLTFSVPDYGSPYGGVWCLTGKLIHDGQEEFSFQCDDKEMGRRGGTYHFYLVNMENFRDKLYQFIIDGKEAMEHCHTTEDLYEWYCIHWKNSALNWKP